MVDWPAFATARRTARKLSPARAPKKRGSIAALAKAWGVDKERLSQIVLDYAAKVGKLEPKEPK